MSETRYFDGGDCEPMPYELWQHNLEAALGGKRGQQALRDLKAALLALPERKLIRGALCQVNPNGPPAFCAVGAYVYRKRVLAGEQPEAVIQDLLNHDPSDTDTATAGKRAGLVWTLAWELGFMNDDRFADRTDEQRFEEFMEWIDLMIAPRDPVPA